MQITDDNCSKDERCRTTLLATSSSSSSTNFYVPITTTVNMQPSRINHKPYVHYHNENDNHNDNDDNIGNEKMKQSRNESIFTSTYHYLQIDRNSINILLKVAAAFVLLCIAGCLVLQHLRINRLDYRIRRIEINSAYSIQVF